MFAIDIVGQDHPLGRLSLEMTIKKIAQTSGQERHHLAHFDAADPPEPERNAQTLAQFVEIPGSQVWRGFKKKGLEIGRKRFELAIDLDECGGVLGRVHADLLRGARNIGPPANDPPIVERYSQDRVAGNHPEAMVAQTEIPDHRGHQHRGYV